MDKTLFSVKRWVMGRSMAEVGFRWQLLAMKKIGQGVVWDSSKEWWTRCGAEEMRKKRNRAEAAR